jgi:Predicted pPIWI-associating nuclease
MSKETDMRGVALDEQLAALKPKAIDDFSRSCLEGARRALGDRENPLRINLFSAAMRILFEHMMDTMAPIDEVLRSPWFKPEKDDGKPTRGQRIVYAIQGGRGERETTFSEFFWLSRALREEPAILVTDVIAAWRGDGGDSLYKLRPSEFARLYRLGYYHKAGDFREQDRSYFSEAAAMHVAGKLNEQRRVRGVAPLDTITLYIRMGYSHFTWKPGDEEVQP